MNLDKKCLECTTKSFLDSLIVENVRLLTTKELKKLWDSDLLDDTGFAVEAIHSELNNRDEGKYCAV